MRSYTNGRLDPWRLVLPTACPYASTAWAQTQTLSIDVPAVQLSGELLVNGDPPPPFSEVSGWIDIDGPSGPGSGFRAGRTADGFYGPVWIIPTDYQAAYSNIDAIGVTHPPNPRVPIGPVVEVDGSAPLDVDLEGAWPGSFTAYGILALESADGTDRVEFGPTVQVPLPRIYRIEGSYSLLYEWANGGTDVPINTRAIVDDAVSVARLEPNSVSSESYSNVTMSPLTWGATLDGAPFPTSLTAYGEIFAVDADGNATSLGRTTDLPHTRALVDGTYDVVYRWRNGGADIPRNANAVVDPGRIVAGPTSASIDIPLVVVDIDPRHNGQTFPTALTAYASLELEASDPEDRFPLGLTTQAPLSVELIPSDYDLIYTAENGANLVPADLDARVAVDLSLTPDGTTLVDIETTTVS